MRGSAPVICYESEFWHALSRVGPQQKEPAHQRQHDAPTHRRDRVVVAVHHQEESTLLAASDTTPEEAIDERKV